jgi:hypothetical protein
MPRDSKKISSSFSIAKINNCAHKTGKTRSDTHIKLWQIIAKHHKSQTYLREECLHHSRGRSTYYKQMHYPFLGDQFLSQ